MHSDGGRHHGFPVISVSPQPFAALAPPLGTLGFQGRAVERPGLWITRMTVQFPFKPNDFLARKILGNPAGISKKAMNSYS